MFVAVSSYDKNGCKTLPSLLANGRPVESGADIGICDFGFRNLDLCSLNWQYRCDRPVAVRNLFLIEIKVFLGGAKVARHSGIECRGAQLKLFQCVRLLANLQRTRSPFEQFPVLGG